MKYHLGALEHAVKDLDSQPLAASIAALIQETKARVLLGTASKDEVTSLVSAAAYVIEAKGKCPENGCIVKREDKWRVVSNRTGKLWPQTYDTKQSAEDALAAYHLRRKGVPPR